MDLESRKISFVQEFLRLENEDLINKLEEILHKRKAELLEEEMRPMSVKQYNKEIDKALDDSKNNWLTKASDLKLKVQKWS